MPFVSALRVAAVLIASAALAHSSTECGTCHGQIAASYRETGMAHSFYKPSSNRIIEDFTDKNEFFHAPSDTHYRMVRRDGNYFQVRWQIGFDGSETNVAEHRIDFVMGSGRHARTYLHRTLRGTLVQLPLGWYAENGGHWAMSPGYDNSHHPAEGRPIGYDCMFCHNAYPETPAGHTRLGAEPVYSGTLPEGIDCARCHGPGEQHVRAAQTAAAKVDVIRKAIVNPARLPGERQMEVCMQCHLQPTSFPLPNAIKRYDRPFFSYRAGEPLSAFILYFDQVLGHAQKGRQDDRFEIASSAYRLRKSACFLKSNNALNCTTCHDPHSPHGGKSKGYDAACRQCHAAALDIEVSLGKHVRGGDCASCHMPKRRTDDVVHVVMTDHYIQRRPPPGDLLANRPERERTEADGYRGQVVPYYPALSPARNITSTGNDLYVAVAQVRDGSNLAKGTVQLARVLQTTRPKIPEPWFELGEAQRNAKRFRDAAVSYREALRRDSAFLPALLALGTVLKETGQPSEAAAVWQSAIRSAPEDARAWNEIGLLGNAEALQKALQLEPEFAAPHNALGILAAQTGDYPKAEGEFREAIRILPSAGDAHGNLANLLAAKQDGPQSLYEFEIALRLIPEETTVRFRYAAVLNAMQRFDAARTQLELLNGRDPKIAEARDLLGNLYERQGEIDRALAEYQAAVQLRPELSRAQLDLGATLARKGEVASAASHLEIAARAADNSVRDLARQLLAELHRIR